MTTTKKENLNIGNTEIEDLTQMSNYKPQKIKSGKRLPLNKMSIEKIDKNRESFGEN